MRKVIDVRFIKYCSFESSVSRSEACPRMILFRRRILLLRKQPYDEGRKERREEKRNEVSMYSEKMEQR
jgi:hypothetical protein